MSKSISHKKPKTTNPRIATQWDTGANGPANRANLIKEPAVDIDPITGKQTPNPNNVTRYRRQSWVELYHAQGKLTADQLHAAKTLYLLYHGRGAADPLAALVVQVDCSCTHDSLAAGVDRRRAYIKLAKQIPPQCRSIVTHVVIQDRSIGSATGRTHARVDKQNMDLLRIGLDAVGG